MRPFRIICVAGLIGSSASFALDVPFTEIAALDQPQINAYVSRAPTSDPLQYNIFGITGFNIRAFYDTGASGILLSSQTAELLGVQKLQVNGQNVVFNDIGIGGAAPFNVSELLYVSLADYHPDRQVDQLSMINQVYRHQFGPVRTKIGPITNDPNPNPFLAGLDVIGMPAMKGKVVVMDMRPVNRGILEIEPLASMKTYVYNPGTAYNPAMSESDPGIPAADLTVSLSYVDFERYTTVEPANAPRASLVENPFIGPNPFIRGGRRDQTPPVKVSYNGQSSEGTWLLDTGAATSILSRQQAANLGVTYVEGTYGTEQAALQGVPLDRQFTLRIGGIGGQTKLAGFYMDRMLLRTDQGDRFNDNDPNHIRFHFAPVLVGDITLVDPETNRPYTLDGIFGMNFLIGSAYFQEAFPIPIIENFTAGAFDFAAFDDPNKKLRLTLSTLGNLPPVPEPTMLSLLALAGLTLRRRRRQAIQE